MHTGALAVPGMAESPLFGAGAHAAAPCPHCGRIFEEPFTIEQDGQPKTIRGHVQGDPVLCVPLEGFTPQRDRRDPRTRKTTRRGG